VAVLFSVRQSPAEVNRLAKATMCRKSYDPESERQANTEAPENATTSSVPLACQ
jgi:hypothetical protein